MSLPRRPAGVRILLAAALGLFTMLPAEAEAQRVVVRSASADVVALDPGSGSVPVTLSGSGLAAVTGAAVEVRGRRTRDVRASLGRRTRTSLVVTLQARVGSDPLEGVLVLSTRRGRIETDVRVTIEAPGFDPVTLAADALAMRGFGFAPTTLTADALAMRGFGFAPITLRTSRPLAMTGYRSDRRQENP